MKRVRLASTAVLLAAGLLSAAACGGARPAAAPEAEAARAAPETELFTGRIVVTGTERGTFATLQVEGRRPVALVGELEPELRRLSAATVHVEGRSAEGFTMYGVPVDALEVVGYEILSIDGESPHVGALLVREEGIWLVAADTVRLIGAPEALRPQSGARIWVVGPRTTEGIRIQSYGIIRPH